MARNAQDYLSVISGLPAGRHPESRSFDVRFLNSGCRCAAPE
jgi:hypothetical protein